MKHCTSDGSMELVVVTVTRGKGRLDDGQHMELVLLAAVSTHGDPIGAPVTRIISNYIEQTH
jgi:hypothetical protein